MPVFSYRALDAERREQQGELQANDRNDAACQLQRRGLLVLSLKPGSRLRRGSRQHAVLRAAELATLTQQLATLIIAGQPVDKALATLLKHVRKPAAQAVLEQVRDQVKAGHSLSQALAAHPATFPPFYTSLVRAGEAAGVLEVTLAQLSSYLERSHRLRGEITNALIYPAFLVVGVIGSLGLLLAYVVPQFVPVFQDLGVPLPLATRVILALGECVNTWGLPGLAMLVGAAWLWSAVRRNPQRREALDQRVWRSRLLGPLVQRLETARLAFTLGTLLNHSVALLPALVISRDISSNHGLRQHLGQATEQVKQGSSLARALSRAPMLPELAIQMIEVGEQSGSLGAMLLKLADLYDHEAKRTLEHLLAALVPTLTLLMAVAVAAIMLAIMLPLMSLTDTL